MDISIHISSLLRFHECVIIPEFGGFISNYKPAVFNSNTNTFTPPLKEVVFNSKINKNDGLLVNYLVENEGIGYKEAHQFIQNFVDQAHFHLAKGESIEWKNFGNFKMDKSGNVIFTATTTFDFIDAYGLKEFNYQPLNVNQQITAYQPRAAVRVIHHRGNAIKIAASVALLLTLSLFPMKNEKQHLQTSDLNPISAIIDSEPTVVETQVIKSDPIISEPVIEENKVAPYILIGGNFQLEENAKTFLAELQNIGHHPEIIRLSNGNFRVAIDSYFDYQKALDAMETYRTNNPGSQAWVSKR